MQTTRFIHREECDKQGEQVLKQLDLYPSLRRPAVKIDVVAESIEGVELDQFVPIKEPDILGFTTRNGTGVKISIAESLSNRYYAKNAFDWEESLWRTTVGHELGHALLHRELLRRSVTSTPLFRCSKNDFNSRPGRSNYDPVEYQANMMMAALLMPEQLVKDAYAGAWITSENHYEIVEDLAISFAVSKSAMNIRLKELKLD